MAKKNSGKTTAKKNSGEVKNAGHANVEKHKFKKGQSGNPKGRPVGTENSATRLKRFLHAKMKQRNPTNGKEESMTVMEQMDLAMINKALKGDVKAYEQIIDRMEGKVTQTNININKVGIDAEEETYE